MGKLSLAVFAVVAVVLGTAGPAWAPHVPQLNVNPSRMRAGEEVSVVGTRGYGFTNPVEVHFNSPDGPVLGSFQPTNEAYAPWGPGTVRIPENTAPGTYYLWATQVLAPTEGHIRGVPARAAIEVVGAGGSPIVGAPVEQAGDPGVANLAREDSPSFGSFVLVGLGAAGLAALVAGVAAVMSTRREPGARAERVTGR
ncbi:MAG: hypothetical protein LC733_07320 [Actinobacteria bacterium]|nr:hypothetical protein [Actinomycetota bacterium]